MTFPLNITFSETTAVLVSLSIILFSGFLVTRLTKLLRLPHVSGYILAGVLIGPCVLHLVPGELIAHMGFVSDIALAFIAFDVGKFFKKEVLREAGMKVIVITLCEALIAGVLVTLSMHWILGMDWIFSLILGAIATATAPASTLMTIRQYHARGTFVNTLLQVVALDDVVCLMTFSIVAAIAQASEGGGVAVRDVLLPIVCNLAALAVGFVCGLVLSKLLRPSRSQDNRLILCIAMLLGISGLCASLEVSPLLSCMVFGATYINLTRDKALYRQINSFTPPIMSIFFIVSGMSLDITALTTVGLVGIAYVFIRIAGKYAGSAVGCALTRAPREVTRYLGLALIPQAGVAIGLAFLGQRLLPAAMGNLLLTIILSSSVLYELIGPVSAKASLVLAGAIPKTPPAADRLPPAAAAELPAGAAEEAPLPPTPDPAACADKQGAAVL